MNSDKEGKGLPIVDLRLPICESRKLIQNSNRQSQIDNRQSAIPSRQVFDHQEAVVAACVVARHPSDDLVSKIQI